MRIKQVRQLLRAGVIVANKLDLQVTDNFDWFFVGNNIRHESDCTPPPLNDWQRQRFCKRPRTRLIDNMKTITPQPTKADRVGIMPCLEKTQDIHQTVLTCY
jgi:hypothetical protein